MDCRFGDVMATADILALTDIITLILVKDLNPVPKESSLARSITAEAYPAVADLTIVAKSVTLFGSYRSSK